MDTNEQYQDPNKKFFIEPSNFVHPEVQPELQKRVDELKNFCDQYDIPYLFVYPSESRNLHYDLRTCAYNSNLEEAKRRDRCDQLLRCIGNLVHKWTGGKVKVVETIL